MALSLQRKKLLVYVLIALGFAGLIGAHEWAAMTAPGGDPNEIAPLILAALGTLCFVAAGLLARALMRDGVRK